MLSQQADLTEKDRLLHRLSRLVEVSVTLNSTLDPDQLLQFIIRAAADLIDCEAASIMLFDETRGQLFFVKSSSGDSQKLLHIPVPLEGSIAGTIFRENRPLVINDVTADPRHYQQVGQQVSFHTHSLLGVPMRIKARVTGVLEALNKRGGCFTEDDTRLLSVIASQAAVAIHNAQLVRALQKAYEELSRIDKLKSDFIAIASHELRTPLGVILGYATFLKEDARGELSDHAERVLSSAVKMRSLIEDMTNLSLLQLGEAKISMQVMPLQEVLLQVLAEAEETAISNQVEITQVLPESPLLVNADREKLQLVFTNLMNNAVRFTPSGGRVRLAACQANREIWVQITDTGIGIAHEELENIFDDFYQVENHLTRHQGGMGLGLSIARGLLKLHQGRVWAESPGDGKGSTFTVALPLADKP